MSVCPTLATDRLVLRPFRHSDLDAYAEILMSAEVRASLHLSEMYGRAEAWMDMARWLGQWELRRAGQWAIEERQRGTLLGRAGLNLPAWPDWPGLEVGWTLHPAWWGNGYATEAGRRSVEYAFEELDANEVYSVILPGNVRSEAVARRLGFEWMEERVLAHFPSAPHGIWRLDRRRGHSTGS